MLKSSPFKIYNASAGSGKTFNLVKEYLVKILSEENRLSFRNNLALTFTNKAVGEMKERIVKMLKEFSDQNILKQPTPMFSMLLEDLELSAEELHKRSKSVLIFILHNYASFDISTIDKFNHRLIRTFSNDLKLPANFEVELDDENIIARAVDKLIDKAGQDQEITTLLLEFSKAKIEDDRSWDVAYDLNEIAKVLLNDDDKFFIERLSKKSLHDFKNLENNLRQKISKIENFLIESANEILNKLDSNDLLEGVFVRNTLPNHFRKIQNLDLGGLYGNQLEHNLANNTKICLKTVESHKAELVDRLVPEISNVFQSLKTKVYELSFLKNALRNIVPLSVLHEINLCVKEITKEENLVLISDFNSIIHNEIKEQPAPYIYERLGERYKDFFIDEFQDTSVFQWENLVPLIENTISQESISGKQGSSMLVGDAKQAIYRWRGGKPEQFINLYNKTDNPFKIEPSLVNLKNNFRSRNTIVNFNNNFFSFVSDSVFSNTMHSDLYSASNQVSSSDGEGLIKIQFLDKNIQDVEEEFNQQILQIIQAAKKDGYQLNDICILTRKNKEGTIIANFLSDQEIGIVSSESLLLNNSPKVKFIITIMTILDNPLDYEAKVSALNFLYNSLPGINDEHKFYSFHLVGENSKFFRQLHDYGINFDLSEINTISIYELVEQIVRSFKLNKTSDAYVQFLLDEIYEYAQNLNLGIKGFLDFWEQKKNKLSVVSPAGPDAVNIMSIHKAKGLEFPIVIFPYASQKIYDDRFPKTWFPVDPEKFSGFENLYVSLKKDLQEIGEIGEQIYNQHRSYLELDSINLLYVALTRPKGRLYILCQNDVSKNRDNSYSRFSELFTEYLKLKNLYEEGKLIYEFGTNTKAENLEGDPSDLDTIEISSTSRNQINLNILTNEGKLWDTLRKEAIEKGNLFHEILSKIKYRSDLKTVIDSFIASGDISEEQAGILYLDIDKLVNDKLLTNYYSRKWHIINEQEIISSNGDLHKPDRIAVNDKNETVIIDYKTGNFQPKHKEQINIYTTLLNEMGYSVLKKFLVYIGKEIEILEI